MFGKVSLEFEEFMEVFGHIALHPDRTQKLSFSKISIFLVFNGCFVSSSLAAPVVSVFLAIWAL